MTWQARRPVKITKFGNLMKAVPAAYPRDHGRVGPIWLHRTPSTGYAKAALKRQVQDCLMRQDGRGTQWSQRVRR
jgi:hypothetical protein